MGMAIGRLFDISGRKFHGTAFAVSATRTLTAFHCVGSLKTGEVNQNWVLLRFRTGFETMASVVVGSHEGDYAILDMEKPLPEGIDPVPLMLRPSEQEWPPCEGWPLLIQAEDYGKVRCPGYPGVYEDPGIMRRPDITFINGEVRADESESSIFDGIPAIELFSADLAAGLDIHGMSGGPVMAVTGQAVTPWAAIGLVRWNPPGSKDKRIGMGGHFFASPVSNIIETHIGELGEAHIIKLKPRPVDPQKPINPRLKYEPEMIPVRAGSFWMGSDLAKKERPRHQVDLPAFCIGKYPVTNGQYHKYIKDMRLLATPEMSWDGNRPYDGTQEHPVAGVTWYQAMAYCEWLRSKTGGRAYCLPTEAQWEKAARGTDGRLYPWGPEWEDGLCNTGEEITSKDAFGKQSVYGCYDMVGNACEWTLTIWGSRSWKRDEEYEYEWAEDGRNDTTDQPHIRRVIRGGRHDSQIEYRCSNCDSCRPDMPGSGDSPIGFRVVLLLDT